MKQKIVLAYSGGLDTSFCILHLIDKGYEVHAVSVNTGGFDDEELKTLESRAYQLGAKAYACLDVTEDYYIHCIRYLIYGNVLRNGTYPLSVSSERAFQAMGVLKYAKENGIDKVSHGSTGAGNDQTLLSARHEAYRIFAPI